MKDFFKNTFYFIWLFILQPIEVVMTITIAVYYLQGYDMTEWLIANMIVAIMLILCYLIELVITCIERKTLI